jgi:hypothetical protein
MAADSQVISLSVVTAILANDMAYSSIMLLGVPSSGETLGDRCFQDLQFLSKVTFIAVSQLNLIGTGAFYGCVALRCISIPSSVTVLGEGCFCGCGSLTTETVASPCQIAWLLKAAPCQIAGY